MNRLILLFVLMLAYDLSVCKANVCETCDSTHQVNISEKVTKPGDAEGGGLRGPVQLPVVCQEGYLLSFDDLCIGHTLRLVQYDEIVYETEIPLQGWIQLSSDFTGDYEIQIIIDPHLFYGFIHLE